MNRRLPVTLVGGFLGAGKTSVLHQFVSEHQGGHLALLVENPGALNLDARALRGLCGAMRRLGDTVVEIPALEETAQIAWLAEKFRELAAKGSFERVLVETGATSNAARLGRHFGVLPGHAGAFAPWAELHQIVCVVDALDFHRGAVLPVRDGAPSGFLDFQRAQIAGASCLVLNKCDLVGDAERAACVAALRQVNPEARLVETAYGELPPAIWSQAGTMQELGLALERPLATSLEDRDASEAPEPVLASMLYRAYRPFHPERFWSWFEAGHPGLWRVKGLVWLATRNLLVGGVSRTRWQNACGGAGIWWAALPREEWPEEPEALARMQETWREPYGDRRQELVLVGEAGALSGLARGLDACLLDAQEYARPVREWTSLPDPFPVWDVGEGE